VDFYSRENCMKNKWNFRSWIWVMIWLLILAIFSYGIFTIIHEKNKVSQVCTRGNCFTVELARTPAEQEVWLMNRVSMPEKSGMLFIFPKSDLYNFRMKDTLIPLDIIRITDKLNVVKVITAQPCIADPCRTYNPEIWATYVLELNAGIAEKYNIVEWTQMKFRDIDK